MLQIVSPATSSDSCTALRRVYAMEKEDFNAGPAENDLGPVFRSKLPYPVKRDIRSVVHVA